MNQRTRRLLAAGLTAAACGCSPSVPLAPPLPVNPIAMQVAPGLGCSLHAAETVYLVVNTVDAKNTSVLPQIAEVVAGEFRAATPAEVVLFVNTVECPVAAEWDEQCRVCHVPVDGVSSSAVVVFCDVLEYDPYTPLRVSLSIRVRRATDGFELVALQGTWLGAPPITPPRPPFHWFRKKGPLRPNVDFAWTAQFEAQSATNVVRHAAHQCVATLATSTGGAPHSTRPMNSPPQYEALMPPPAPPALPEMPAPAPDPGPETTASPVTEPPLTELPVTESATSAPEESHPSP